MPIVLVLAACATPDPPPPPAVAEPAVAPDAAPLDAGFEARISEGWACEQGGWVGLDAGHDLMVRAGVPAGPLDLTDPGDGFVVAFTGADLVHASDTNPCDDVIIIEEGSPKPRFDHRYQGVAGTADLYVLPDGRMGLSVAGLVLQGVSADTGDATAQDDPDVTVESWEFPAFRSYAQ